MNRLLDVSDIVATIRVPTLVIHRTDDKNISVEGGRFLAPIFPAPATSSSREAITSPSSVTMPATSPMP